MTPAEIKQAFMTDHEFQIQEEVLDFDELTNRLIALEQQHEISSLEIFKKYLRGELTDDVMTEAWTGLFFLYLGTAEIRSYSC